MFQGVRRICAISAGCTMLMVAAHADARATTSGVTAVDITDVQTVGVFDGVTYVRKSGVVHGVVAPGENVDGLAALPKDANGEYDYAAKFEIIAPLAGTPANSTVFVDAENRGSGLFLVVLSRDSEGFFFSHHISYARVQWQTGIAAGVPDQAQGVGEVVFRDFGRLLAGERDRLAPAADSLGTYKTRVFGGISQSAWFVNAFIAEGFNADPDTGRAVYAGALAIDGAGDWMTINQLARAHGFNQYPYLNEAGVPLLPNQLLTRPKSDPFYVDVANYNDFFRVRASVSSSAGFTANMRRYDWPSPHAPGSKSPAGGPCNGGAVVTLDPISYAPYARALVVELVKQIGGDAAPGTPALPANALFKLGVPPDDPAHFNALPGVDVRPPALDANGQPVGGVRFAEVEAPFGEPLLPQTPVGLSSISDTCGNSLLWQPYSAARLSQIYGSREGYLRAYAAALDRLIAGGYVLAEDRPAMLKTAAGFYSGAGTE